MTATPAPAAGTDRPLLAVEEVWKRYGDHHVLRGVSLDVAPGEVLCLLGPSGSGKSTLLRCVNRLERIQRGSIRVDGELVGYREQDGRLVERDEADIARHRALTGMVFQHFNLFPHMTVLENLTEAPRRVAGMPAADAAALAGELLGRVGLADRAHAYPRQLSGGQQQRVAIARALAMRPRLMLFDEPTSALDPELVGDVLRVMRDLAAEGMTMLVVTHEMSFARDVADRLVFMDGGRVLEAGPPARMMADPEHPRTREFLARFR
jgi:polar amino acid transport system ATP-binding protein